MSDKLAGLRAKAAEPRATRERDQAKKVKDIYEDGRFQMGSSMVDDIIVSAMADHRNEAVLYAHRLEDPTQRDLFDKPQYGYSESIIDRLASSYPAPFEVSGFVDLDHYEISIRWPKSVENE